MTHVKPKLKVTRRLGSIPSLTQKISKIRKKSPGEHGTIQHIDINKELTQTATSLQSTLLKFDFKENLLFKQFLKTSYHLTEKQFKNYFNNSLKSTKNSYYKFLKTLQTRLDYIIYKFGFSKTIAESKQLINHGHICVNFKKVTSPNFECKINDKITFSVNKKAQSFYEFYLHKYRYWLTFLVQKFNLSVNVLWSNEDTLIIPFYLFFNIKTGVGVIKSTNSNDYNLTHFKLYLFPLLKRYYK